MLLWLDYGARFYDPTRPTFGSIDPKAEKFYNISPYAYCFNNPITYLDPDGKQGIPAQNMGNGQWSTALSSTYIPPVPAFTLQESRDLQNSSHTLSQMGGVDAAEMWMDSPSESIGGAVLKVVASIGYEIVNGPVKASIGKTIGGSEVTSNERVEAFGGTVATVATAGGGKALGITKTPKNPKDFGGFNDFVKKNPGISSNKGLPKGMSGKTNAGKLYQVNKTQQQAVEAFDKTMDAVGAVEVTKDIDENLND